MGMSGSGAKAATRASSAAGTIATAAFFAPEIVTSPLSVLPPLITYLVKIYLLLTDTPCGLSAAQLLLHCIL